MCSISGSEPAPAGRWPREGQFERAGEWEEIDGS